MAVRMNSAHSNSAQQMADAKLSLQPIRFAEFLLERSLLDDEQLLEVLADHWSNGGLVGLAVSRRGFLTVDEVEQQAQLYHGLDVIELDVIEVAQHHD